MRIAYIHQYFIGPTGSGGTRSYEMARRLVARGHEVHMIASDPSPHKSARTWRIEVLDGISIHWYPVEYSNQMKFKRRIFAFVDFAWRSSWRARSIKADLVYASSTPLTIAIPGIFATLFRKSPMVFEVRDLWPEVPIALGALRDPILRSLARMLEKLAYHNSSQIVALSSGMKEGVIAVGYPAEKITVIPNASNLELFQGKEAQGRTWRAKYSWLGERPLIVHCGAMGKVNDVGYLAKVAAEVIKYDSEVRFVVIGAGVEEAKVRALAQSLGVLEKSFFMLPSVPKSEVPAILAACDISTILVAPIKELENNSANKLFDSFAAGKPIVINYGGWQQDLLDDSNAGIRLDALDHKQAAISLVSFLNDSERMIRAGQASLSLAESKFSLNSLTLQLAELLEATVVQPRVRWSTMQ